MNQETARADMGVHVAEPKNYRIGGVTYRIEPASFEQHQWLEAGPLAGVDFSQGVRQIDLEILIRLHGPAILGIVLLAEGQTREQKGEAGRAAAQALGQQVARQLSPSEVRAIAQDFFIIDGYENLAFFVDLVALAARTPAPDTATISTPVSVSSRTAISPGSGSSPEPGDRTTPSSPSVDSASGAVTSGPSLVSAESRCRG